MVSVSGSIRESFLEGPRSTSRAPAEMESVFTSCRKNPRARSSESIALKEMRASSATRFTVVLPSGKVIGDTFADPAAMDNHSDRPEIRDALLGHDSSSTRFSFTVKESMLYTAAPIRRSGMVAGVVRASFR